MPLYLKIATVNCRGLRDHAKRLAFFTHTRTLDVHVLCLQETYSKPQDELIWQNDWGEKIKQFLTQTLRSVGKPMLVRQSCLTIPVYISVTLGRTVEAGYWPPKYDAIASFFKWSMSMPTILPIQNKKGKDSSIRFMISPT